MKKVGLIVFLSFVIIFSSTVLAATWPKNSWNNGVPKACGDYSSDCDSCGALMAYKSNTVTESFNIQKGMWRIKVFANNIQVQTSCHGDWCFTSSDCSVKATKIDVTASIDGSTFFHEPKTGSWAIAEGDGDQSNYESLSQIASDWNYVTCTKDNCVIEYKWMYEIYGFANYNTGIDRYIKGTATLDASMQYERTFDFSLSLDQNSGTTTQGSSVSTNVNATLTVGNTQPVSFDLSGLPSGASYTFTPTNCNPPCKSNITITTGANTPTGTYTITIKGTGGGVTKEVPYTLTINQKPAFDFSLTLDPSSGTVNQGSSTTANVTVKLVAGDALSVSLSHTTQPSPTEMNVNFNPSSVTPTSAGINSTMTISTSSNTQTGGYTITVTGTAGILTRTATYTLNVNPKPVLCMRTNPTVTITPSANSSLAGSTLQYTVTVSNADSGTDCTKQTYVLTYGCPSGWTCSFVSSSLSINPGSTGTTTISITSPSTASGSNSFSVIATSGSYTGTSSATYVIGAPCSGSIAFVLTPSTVKPGDSFAPSATGLSSCDGLKIEFRNKSCTDNKIGECLVLGTGCGASSLLAPSSAGSHTYVACIDKNKDGDFKDEGEYNSTTLIVTTSCLRDNPTIIIDPEEITKEAGGTYTFTITVRNGDLQSCSESTFKLTSDCPSKWTCTFDKNNIPISPGSSASANLTIKSSSTASGQQTINLIAVNLGDTKYNSTKSLIFKIGSKCDGASIKVSDVQFYAGRANLTVENNGTSSNLTISSIEMTDKNGKTYKPSNLPIRNFDVGNVEIVTFTSAPTCENFSKIVVSTDCPKASVTSTSKRCLTTTPKAIVKIKEVTYKEGVVNLTLKNDGSSSISSDSIKILLNGQEFWCKEGFELVSKGSIKSCEITDFVCEDTATVEITEPTADKREFSCLEEVKINVTSCKVENCKQPEKNFVTGDKLYLNIEKEEGVDTIAFIAYNNGNPVRIDLSKPYALNNPGTYVVNVTASKEGYKKTIKELTLTVEKKSSNLLLKLVLIALFILVLASFVYYRFKKTKKRQSFEELYEKYRKANYSELYKKYGKRKRPQRRF